MIYFIYGDPDWVQTVLTNFTLSLLLNSCLKAFIDITDFPVPGSP